MIRLAMMASGGGTTAEHIWRQCQEGGMLYGLVEPVCLVASRPGIGAVKRLREAGFRGRIHVVCPGDLRDEQMLEVWLSGAFRYEEIDWFGQYGWLPRTPARIAQDFRGINQHPAPVPWFGGQGMYGRAPHSAVLRFFSRANRSECQTEVTAQLVHPEFDQGARIAVITHEPLALRYGRSPDNVEEMRWELLRLEHQVQVEALLRIVAHDGEIPPPVESSFELRTGEEELLTEAKAWAIAAYPHG